MSRTALLLVVLVGPLLSACGSATPTFAPLTFGPPSATIAPREAAHEAASKSMSGLLSGDPTTPTLVDWSVIEQGIALPSRQRSAMCEALQTPHFDNVIAGLVSAGLNALWVKLGHKPSEEAAVIVDLATTFVIKTCPSWDPSRPPVPTPIATPWYPSGYLQLISDPDVAWTWVDRPTCSIPGPCWNVDVVARTGCSSVSIAVAAYDGAGVIVDLGFAQLGPTLPNVPLRIEIVSDASTAKTATLDFISCS
jgi:hypothetical protein